MDQLISQFFTTGSVTLAVLVTAATFLIRRLVETAVPSAKKAADENDPALTYKTTFSRYWNQVILYAIPVLAGMLFGVAHLPFIFDVPGLDTMSSRVLYGGVVGWMSSYLYKILRITLKKKTGVDLEPSPSVMPGATEDTQDEMK